MDEVLEEECASQCIKMKTKTKVKNEKITQADAFTKDRNYAEK